MIVSFEQTMIFKAGGGHERPVVQHFPHNIFECASGNDFFVIFFRFGLQLGPTGSSWKSEGALCVPLWGRGIGLFPTRAAKDARMVPRVGPRCQNGDPRC